MTRIFLAAVAAMLFTTISVSAGSMLDDVKILDTKRQEITGSIPADDNHSTKLTNPVQPPKPKKIRQAGDPHRNIQPSVFAVPPAVMQQVHDSCHPRTDAALANLLDGVDPVERLMALQEEVRGMELNKMRKHLSETYGFPLECIQRLAYKTEDGTYQFDLVVFASTDHVFSNREQHAWAWSDMKDFGFSAKYEYLVDPDGEGYEIINN